MTGPAEQPVRRPGPLAAAIVAVSVRALPAEQRDRYSDEFTADLCYLGPGRRSAHALGLLAGTLTLRRALQEAAMTDATQTRLYWKCRLGRHRYALVNDTNPENRQSTHLECTRCLKFKEIKEYDMASPTTIAGGGGGVGGGAG